MTKQPQLENWSDVNNPNLYRGLLLGNGASQAVWEGFGYSSLFKVACENGLDPKAKALFKEFKTENFESVLEALHVSTRVDRVLNFEHDDATALANVVRGTLVSSVKQRHVPHALLPASTFESIKKALRKHRFVYTTNYDLLVYWSFMHDNPASFLDYFFDSQGFFDPYQTDKYFQSDTSVLFLHGGIHLETTPEGRTRKRISGPSGALLESFDNGGPNSKLFVAEGTSLEKRRSILGSDYLRFANNRFAQHSGGLVVFGHSLGMQDAHLLGALRVARVQDIAISVLPGNEERKTMLNYQSVLAKYDLESKHLRFFDSTTHPLGSPDLRVEDPEQS